MSMGKWETWVRDAARVHFNNQRLRNADLMEWSSNAIEPQKGEVAAYLADVGMYVSIKIENDKRAT